MTTDVEMVPEVTQELPANEPVNAEAISAPPEPEAIETQAPPEQPKVPRSGIELQQAYDAGEPLSNDERANLREHQRAEDNRARAAQYARQQQQENAARVQKLRSEFPDRLANKAIAEIQAAVDEGRNISPTLLKSYLKEEADSLLAEIEPAVLMPRDAGLKAQIAGLVQEMGGDPRLSLQYMADNGFSFDDVVQAYGEAREERGKRQAPGAQDAAKLRAEVTQLKAEVERLTGERGKSAPGAGGREATASAAELSYEKIQKMTATQLKDVPDDILLSALSPKGK